MEVVCSKCDSSKSHRLSIWENRVVAFASISPSGDLIKGDYNSLPGDTKVHALCSCGHTWTLGKKQAKEVISSLEKMEEKLELSRECQMYKECNFQRGKKAF